MPIKKYIKIGIWKRQYKNQRQSFFSSQVSHIPVRRREERFQRPVVTVMFVVKIQAPLVDRLRLLHKRSLVYADELFIFHKRFPVDDCVRHIITRTAYNHCTDWVFVRPDSYVVQINRNNIGLCAGREFPDVVPFQGFRAVDSGGIVKIPRVHSLVVRLVRERICYAAVLIVAVEDHAVTEYRVHVAGDTHIAYHVKWLAIRADCDIYAVRPEFRE